MCYFRKFYFVLSQLPPQSFWSRLLNFLNNELIYMHSNIHDNHFINHLLLIAGVNGARYKACLRAQTIELILIYDLHGREHTDG